MDWISKVKETLIQSGTILYPTDTIWGIGCSAHDEVAIDKVFEIKHRPKSKNFIILVDTPKRLQQIVDVPPLAWDIMDVSEKPVTIVYDNPKNISPKLIADDHTIAIRLTQDKICQKIIQAINTPIISTSANLFNQPPPKSFNEISSEIKQKVDYIIPEKQHETAKYLGSSIIYLSQDGKIKVIRE